VLPIPQDAFLVPFSTEQDASLTRRQGLPAPRFCCKFVGFVIRVFTVTALLLKKYSGQQPPNKISLVY
jgi:hypothetical protein